MNSTNCSVILLIIIIIITKYHPDIKNIKTRFINAGIFIQLFLFCGNLLKIKPMVTWQSTVVID